MEVVLQWECVEKKWQNISVVDLISRGNVTQLIKLTVLTVHSEIFPR